MQPASNTVSSSQERKRCCLVECSEVASADGRHNTFAGDKSMRINYANGVDAYYQQTGAQYRNPHFPALIQAMSTILDEWVLEFCTQYNLPHQAFKTVSRATRSKQKSQNSLEVNSFIDKPSLHGGVLHVLDMACGSGEATQAIQMWWTGTQQHCSQSQGRCMTTPYLASTTCVPAFDNDTVVSSSAQQGPTTSPLGPPWVAPAPAPAPATCACGNVEPLAQQLESQCCLGTEQEAQEQQLQQMQEHRAGQGEEQGQEREQEGSNGQRIQEQLMIPDAQVEPGCSGSGELRGPLGLLLHVEACDPYTQEAYRTWVGRPAQSWSFQDIADGALDGRAFHLCVCSYALHVLDEGRLFSTLMALSLVAGHLVVLSPHKRPGTSVGPHMGWELCKHTVVERVHAWLYRSINNQAENDLEQQLRQQ